MIKMFLNMIRSLRKMSRHLRQFIMKYIRKNSQYNKKKPQSASFKYAVGGTEPAPKQYGLDP